MSRCIRTQPYNVWKNEEEGERSRSEKYHTTNGKSS